MCFGKIIQESVWKMDCTEEIRIEGDYWEIDCMVQVRYDGLMLPENKLSTAENTKLNKTWPLCKG